MPANIKNKIKSTNFPEVGKGIAPIKEKTKLSKMYSLKNIDNLIFFKYLTIISFIAFAECICLLFTTQRSDTNIYSFISLVGIVPFVFQSMFLLAAYAVSDWLIKKEWFSKPFLKTKYKKAQIFTILFIELLILYNGGLNINIAIASNIAFALMLLFTALAFYDTQNISLGILIHSTMKLFEHLTLASNIPIALSLTVITLLSFLFFILYRAVVKSRKNH